MLSQPYLPSRTMPTITIIILPLVFLIFFATGIFLIQTRFNPENKNFKATDAIITRITQEEMQETDSNDKPIIKTQYHVYVSYVVDDKKYEDIEISSNDYEDWSQGDEIRIFYDKNDPTIIKKETAPLGLAIMSLAGSFICLTFSIINIIAYIRESKTRKILYSQNPNLIDLDDF